MTDILLADLRQSLIRDLTETEQQARKLRQDLESKGNLYRYLEEMDKQ